ncbi:MAG: hypothetical protein AB6733_00260 [Clostridiaceae bacterium]
MNRRQLFDILDQIYPCYAVGEHQGECTEAYVVLKYDTQSQSLLNAKCGWQFVHIFLYAPLGDITVLDKMVIDVQAILAGALEFTGDISPEVVDDTMKAYTRRIKYRIPKEVM